MLRRHLVNYSFSGINPSSQVCGNLLWKVLINPLRPHNFQLQWLWRSMPDSWVQAASTLHLYVIVFAQLLKESVRCGTVTLPVIFMLPGLNATRF